jgi:peptide/nickel transport system substrate-binding protein
MRWTVFRPFVTSCLLVGLALPVSARTRPHYGGTLVVETEDDAWKPASSGQPSFAKRLVFDGLTQLDENGAPRPSLATRWESENNNHRWQFWLRTGVHFQDGSALTGSAVEASLTAVCGAACPWTSVRAQGSSIVFTSDSPMPNLPSLLAADGFLIARPAPITSSSTLPAGPVIGTGPFQVDQFSNGFLSLAANDACWQGRPFLDKIEIHGHKSTHDQWLDLSVGRADLVDVPAEQLRQAREQRLKVVTSGPVSLLAVAVSDSGALSNPNLRTAIAQSIDRGALSNFIFQKQGDITASLLPASLTGYAFLFPADRDANKARELRGGLTPPQLTLTTDNNAAMQLAAQRIALNLRDTGFNIQVTTAAGAQHGDLALLKLTLASTRPQAALESFFRAAGAITTVSSDSPADLYHIERDFLNSSTLIPLLYLPRAYAVSGRVRDLRLSPDGVPMLADVSFEDLP